MNFRVLSFQPLGVDFETEWLTTELLYPGRKNPLYIASLQIIWEGVEFAENCSNYGTIQIMLSNDAQTPSVVETIEINTANNTQNAVMLPVDIKAEFYKIKYTKKDITGGYLHTFASYQQILGN